MTINENAATNAFRHERLVKMLCRFWEDVNGRIWLTRSDDRAKVLRSFRSRGDRGYSRKFAWLNMALQAVDVRRKSRKDFALMEQLGGEGLANLIALRKLARNRRTSRRQEHEVLLLDGEVWEGFEEGEADLCAMLEQFEQNVDRLLEQAPGITSALEGALPKALRGDFGRSQEEDIYLLAFELRRAGFRQSEIIALCEFGPGEAVRKNNSADFRHLKYKENARIGQKLKRMFVRAGEKMPSQGSGIRGPVSSSSDLLSIRTCSSTDDADTDRNPAVRETRE